MQHGDLIQGSWSTNHGVYTGTLTITGPYQYPCTGGTYPYQPSVGVPGPIGLSGVQGPFGVPNVDQEPSEEMIKIATKLLHDPDFEVGKFLARILAKHLSDHIAEYSEDEVVKKYLPEK